jgi:hypothetical protein
VAAVSAVATWASGLLYSVSFVFVARSAPTLGAGLSGFFLAAGGILGASALLGLALRLRAAGGDLVLWPLFFGLAGALAATLHGGYELANALHPADTSVALSQVDPRGLGTFGLAAISILAFGWLIARDPGFPTGLAYLAYLSGVLLALTYLARLIVLTPSNPLVLVPAALEGFLVNPAWYLWLGAAMAKPAPTR